jgi:hypothetical protein
MKALLIATSLMFGLTAAAIGHAQVPAGAPAGTNGLCKDGSYSSSDTKKGACRGHKGVKEWYAADSVAPAAAPAAKTAKTEAAAAPSAAGPKPANATGLCKDGTYFTGAEKKGACRGHKGVQDWYGAAAASAPAKPAAPMPAAPAPAPKMTPPTPAAPAPMAPAPKAPSLPATAAAGGGNGKVWVNTESKVYHCPDDRYYGKTKQGEYMSESDAIAKGSHASHGKACAK